MTFRYLDVTWTLREPAVMANGMPRVGNDTVSLPYIPARAQRGVLSAFLADQPALHDEAIAKGGACLAPAYPTAGRRDSCCVPTPASFRVWQQKGSETPLLVDLTSEIRLGEGTLQRPPPLLALSANGTPNGWVTPSFQELVRIQRDRRKGRPTQSTGGPFHSLALAPGQSFKARWRLRSDIADELRSQLANRTTTARLGTAKHKAFGGAPELTIDDGGLTTQPNPVTNPRFGPAGEFYVLLTGTALVRDPLTGEDDPAALPRVVADRFAGHAEVFACAVERSAVGGYHGRWPGNLPIRWAAAPGSVLRLRATNPDGIDEHTLVALQHEPLGDNWADGHGGFIILPVLEEGLVLGATRRERPPPRPPSASSSKGPLVDVQSRLYQAAANREVVAAAISSASTVQGYSGGTNVFGWLRQLLHTTNTAGSQGLDALRRAIGQHPPGALSENARRALAHTRVASGPFQAGDNLLDVLRSSCEDPAEFFTGAHPWAPTVLNHLETLTLARPDGSQPVAATAWLNGHTEELVALYWQEWLYRAAARLRREQGP